MMEIIIGLISLLLALVSYSLYFRDMFGKKTRPHAITWLIWSALNGFIFLQQLSHDAGPGAWVTGAAAVANLLIFLFSFKYGERNITRLDWLCLAVALLVITLWLNAASDELTVILACVIFLIGFIPTFRKSFKKPSEETILTFTLNSTKFFLALFALNTVTLVTALYPITLGVVNALFVIFLLARGSVMKKSKKVVKRSA